MVEREGEPSGPSALRGASRRPAPLPIGTPTQWGVIAAVGVTGGERYYWMLDGNDTAMIPGSTVEQAHAAERSEAPEPKAKGPNPLLLLALLLTGCGFNPTEGDFGPVELVPEEETCTQAIEDHDPYTGEVTRREVEVPCEGPGHDLKLFGWRL